MKAKDFEKVCAYRMEREEKDGVATMTRYGVQASMLDGKWIPITSLPDFEGVLPPDGHQFVFDCKVCSQASFPLDDDKFKRRQFRHMVTRSRFGATCFLLIHFTERVLKQRTDEAMTVAFPVAIDHPFWEQFDRGEVKRISRLDAEQYGFRIEWSVKQGCRKESPDIVAAVESLRSTVNA